jgi:hypothetical protein
MRGGLSPALPYKERGFTILPYKRRGFTILPSPLAGEGQGEGD